MTSEAQQTALVAAMGVTPENSWTPNYPHCLNACFEMENWMHQEEDRGYRYDVALCLVVQAYDNAWTPCNHMRLYHATAEQRCEAALKSLGLWVESDERVTTAEKP